MPHPITPVVEFTDPIVVPDGDDFMNDAADVVELFVQGLANRDEFIKAALELLDSRAVKNDQANTIAGQQTINSSDDTVAPIRITRAPGQDAGAFTGNGWRRAFEAACDASGGRTIILWQGNNDSGGVLAVTVNAYWQIDPPRWRQQNAAKKSFVLMFVPDGGTGLFYSVQAAGVSQWSSWPYGPDVPPLSVGGGIIAGDSVLVQKFIQTIDGKITAGDGFVAAGDGEFEYSSERTRAASPIPLGNVCGSYTKTVAGIKSNESNPGNRPAWPLRVPPGCGLGTIQIMHTKVTTDETKFYLLSRAPAWDVPTTGIVIERTVSTTTSGIQVTEIDASAISGVSGVEFFISWDRPDSGADDDEVWALRMIDWTEDGVRNEVL